MSDYSKLAREVELSGLRHLKAFYGDRAKIVDLADSSGYDFQILHSNSSLGIGEFAWLEDKVKFSAWKALTKQEQHHIIPLKPGSGQWALSVKHESRINTLYRDLPALVEKMMNLGTYRYEIYDTWPRDETAQACRDLGIIYIHQIEDSELDQAFYLLEGSGGMIPNDLSLLAKCIEDLFYGDFSDCWEKLSGTLSEEKHVFLKVGSLIPFNLSDTLRTDRNPVAISNITFPDRITHIWLEGSDESMRNVLWRREDSNTYF